MGTFTKYSSKQLLSKYNNPSYSEEDKNSIKTVLIKRGIIEESPSITKGDKVTFNISKNNKNYHEKENFTGIVVGHMNGKDGKYYLRIETSNKKKVYKQLSSVSLCGTK